MSGLLDNVDPDGMLEYSVVYTDRSVNHMSAQFQQTMRDIHQTLTDVYSAHRAIVVPGSGARTSVAWSFATAGSVFAGRRSSMRATFQPRMM